MKLVREVKGKMKGFCRYVSSKRKSRENTGPLLNRAGNLQRTNTSRCPRPSPGPLFIKSAFSNPRPLRPVGKSRARNTYPWWRRVRLGNPYTNWT